MRQKIKSISPVSITMIAILLFVQILSNWFAQIPNISDEETLETDVEIPSLTSARNNHTGGNNTGGGNNSSTHNDAHCLIVNNLTINLTYYVTLDLVNTCSKDIYYPGINATADHSGVSGFSSQANWWYLIYANGTYNMSWQLSFDSSVQNGTNITLDFEAVILNCGTNGTWHDCPNSNSSSLSYQFAFSSINNNNTGGNNNNSNVISRPRQRQRQRQRRRLPQRRRQ